MYSADSQGEANRPGTLYFEMFPGNRPPTTNVMFLEAEDGCKGTPTPSTKGMQTMNKAEAYGTQVVHSSFHSSTAIVVAGGIGTLLAAFVIMGSRRFRTRCEMQSDVPLTVESPCE